VKHKQGNRNTAYIWGYNAKKAVPLLENILPYLLLKKQQAELCLLLQKGNAARQRKGRGWQEAPELTQERVDMWKEIKSLNRRGKEPLTVN